MFECLVCRQKTIHNFLGVLFVLVVLLCQPIKAQYSRTIFDGYTPTGVEQGAPAGAYALSGFENVNLFNGNLNVNMPLMRIGGRGTAGYVMNLPLDLHWEVFEWSYVGEQEPAFRAGRAWRVGYSPGFLLGMTAADKTPSPSGGIVCDGSVPYYTVNYVTRLNFIMPDGSEIQLHDKLYAGNVYEVNWCASNPAGQNRGKVFVSADGESTTFISDTAIIDNISADLSAEFYPSGYLLMKDGSRYRIDDGRVSWIRDRNGNKITLTYQYINYAWKLTSITDSLNRQVIISYTTTLGSYDSITFKGYGQANRTIKVYYDYMQYHLLPGSMIQQANQLFPEVYSGNYYYPGNWNHDPGIVSKVELPDGRSYQFRYNSYGEIARIVLPTGGGIDYEYAASVYHSSTGTYDNQYGLMIYRRVTKRTMYNSLTTTTDPANPPSGTREKIEKYFVDPPHGYVSNPPNGTIIRVEVRDNNDVLTAQSKHYFYGKPYESENFQAPPVAYSWWPSGKEYKTENFNVASGSAGAVLRTGQQVWSPTVTIFDPVGWVGAPSPNPNLAENTGTLNDTNQVSKQTFSYDQYNNQTDVYEYHYGTGSPGSLARRIHTDYLTSGYDTIVGGTSAPDAVATIHIRSLPTERKVYDAGGTLRSRTAYEYDNYNQGSSDAFHASLVNRTSISGLVSRNNQTPAGGYNPVIDYSRGNVTKTTNYLLDNSGNVTGSVSGHAQFDIAGNVVKTLDPRSTTSSLIATNFDFSDRFGSPDDDARANSTPMELSGQYSFAFPTKVTNALGHEAYTQFDYYIGKPVNTEDPNGIVSSVAYGDNLDRPTQAIQARYKYGSGATSVKRQMTIDYDDTNRRITTSGDRDTYNDNILTGRAYYDGLGRTWRSATYEGNTGSGNTWTISDTQFDALGRVWQVSNPYRAADPNTATPPSGTWTTTNYDALSRVTTVQTPDTATVTTGYSGNAVTVTDQTGKQRRSLTDALGRLIRVDEPNGCNNCLGTVSSPAQPTDYLYDALDSLRQVTQGSQNRYFMYDSLSRLIRAKNPEQAANGSIALSDPITGNSQWSMAYSYDAAGNMLTRVDARNVTTTYAYDNLNRNTSVSYNDGVTPGVNRYYDGATNGIGRFYYNVTYNTHPVTSGLAYHRTFITEYDAMGRAKRYVPGFYPGSGNWIDYQILRSYDLAGNVTQQTYPSNRTITNGYDAAGRLNSFTGTLGDGNSRNYATGITYTPAGQMSRETFGMQSATLYHNLHYNNRLQLVDIRVGDSSSDEWNWSRGALISYYGTAARDAWNPFANSTDNNGNVLRQLHYVPLSGGGYVLPQLDDYNYDELNRIKSVTEAQLNSGGGWTFNLFTQNFNYDRWGNRTVSCSPCQPGVTGDVFTIDTATNRITAKNGTGMTYDSAGNQTYDATGNRWFDGENRMHKAVQGGTTSHYVYDADGKRVRRIIGSTETWMIYGVDGELVAEYAAAASATNPQKEYGYRSGQLLIAAETSPLKITWLVTDQLGTPRMNIRGTGTDGGSLASVTRHDYLPFGEDLIAGIRVNGGSGQHGYEPPPDGVRQKFTGHERDGETGLDFMQARYFSSVQGRFTGPDPVAGSCWNPQSLNAYSYVWNNPLKLTDPTGMIVSWEDSEKKKKKGETEARTDAQRKYENRIKEMLNSKDPKVRERGQKLQATYERLQNAKETFHVVKENPRDASSGELTYAGQEGHLYVNLKGNSSEYGALTDVQKIAHEFKHGEQFLDGLLGFAKGPDGKWHGYRDDLVDEANAFITGFEAQPLDPAQRSNKFLNAVESARPFGLQAVVNVLDRQGPYVGRSNTQIPISTITPSIYAVPRSK